MKRSLLLLAICIVSNIYSQSADIFQLQLGKKAAHFKYSDKTLSLLDTVVSPVNFKYPWAIDTVTAINPKTLEETIKIVANTGDYYHIEAEMTYSDFLALIKAKFDINNAKKHFIVSAFNLYYETATKGEYMKVTNTDKIDPNILTKLSNVAKGGFILLSLKTADQGQVSIDAEHAFLALIHIKK